MTGSYREGRVIHVNPDDVPAGSGQELARILDREVGLHDNPASILRGTSALRSRIENASILARPVRPKIVALDFAGTEGRVLRGAQSSPGAKPVGYRPGSFNGEARDLEALAGNPDTHLVVQRRDNGFAIYRAQPRPPETLMVPNKPSLIMALKNYEHTVKAGPPPVKALNILTDGLGPTELDLMTQTLANRMGGAGGKPPFGGKPTMAFADGPEPGRNSWRISMAKSESKPLPHENPGGARTHTIAVEGRGSDAVLSGKPQWHLAEFSFPEPGSYKLTPPEFQGSGIQIGEISVPLDIPKSGVKATLFRAFAKFRETLDAGRLKGMNAAVTKLFKGITEGDLYAALERYKTMMLEEFKAERIKVEFSREGMNFIVTEEPAIREGAWRG